MSEFRKEFRVSFEPGLNIQSDPTWFESLKANYAYNWGPLAEWSQENRLFANVNRDPGYNALADIGDKYMPYYEDLIEAKTPEHMAFIKRRIDRRIERDRVIQNGSTSAMLLANIADPLIALAVVPGFNLSLAPRAGVIGGRVGSTLSSAGRYGISGGLYGAASEGRRAPFAVGDAENEVRNNLLSATFLGAAFGGVLRGVSYGQPFLASTANKVGRLANGESFKHVFSANKAVLDDGVARAAAEDPMGLDYVDFIGTPSKRILGAKDVPDKVKAMQVMFEYNSGVPLKSNKLGLAVQSLSQRIAPYYGVFYRYENKMRDLFTQDMGMGEKVGTAFGVFLQRGSTFDEWYKATMRAGVKGDSVKSALTDAQKQAIEYHRTLLKQFDEDARFVGMLRDDAEIKAEMKGIREAIEKKTARMAEIEKGFKGPKRSITMKQEKLRDTLTKEINDMRDRLVVLEDVLDSATRKNYLFPIYYDKKTLKHDFNSRNKLVKVFEQRYERDRLMNPGATFDTSAYDDAVRTVKRIVEEAAEDLEDTSRPAGQVGRAKHMKFRKTNVTEAEVEEFMLFDIEAMFNYIEHMGKNIEFNRMFDGKKIDDLLDEAETEMRKSKMSEKRIGEVRRDLSATYERAMGAFVRDPDRFDNQLAQALKSTAGYAFLHGAGVSSITDLGSVVMAHGMENVLRAGAAAAGDVGRYKMRAAQGRAGGAALDMVRNISQRRMLGDSLKRIQPNALERAQEMGNRVFYTANILGPTTVALKDLDGFLANHKFIEDSKKLVAGDIDVRDLQYLARYGIDKEMAEYILSQPIDETGALKFANTDAWDASTPAARNMLMKYQSAVTAHSDNTVIYAQSFDKPLIMDGIVYFKDNPVFASLRQKFPQAFAIDQRASTKSVRLVRFQSGMLSIPFTFMNFAMAANSKIVGAIADPLRRYRLQGAASLIGLSYVSLSLKKPDWWFEKKDSPELAMRIVDHSGVLGIYSDLGYMGLNFAASSGMYDPDDSIFKPRYMSRNKDERMTDALVDPLGAPVGMMLEYGRAIRDYANGEYNEGNKRLIYNAPFLGLFGLRDDMMDLMISEGRGRF